MKLILLRVILDYIEYKAKISLDDIVECIFVIVVESIIKLDYDRAIKLFSAVLFVNIPFYNFNWMFLT